MAKGTVLFKKKKKEKKKKEKRNSSLEERKSHTRSNRSLFPRYPIYTSFHEHATNDSLEFLERNIFIAALWITFN